MRSEEEEEEKNEENENENKNEKKKEKEKEEEEEVGRRICNNTSSTLEYGEHAQGLGWKLLRWASPGP
eukprot:4176633-Pyramimonas_sp.AAC.1